MLDFPAAGEALWAIFDAGGPRPEFVLPTLWAESGFEPSIQNLAGASNFGVNQATPGLISSYASTDPGTYVTWTASQQIATVVRGMLLDLVSKYGPLRSGARVEQANFLPSTLSTARSLDAVLTRFPEAAYQGNVALDTANKGTITIRDLAAFLTRGAKQSGGRVQAAIAQTYDLRPDERPREMVLGDDFGSGAGPLAVTAALAFLVYAWVRG
jgi:hypothetical protein